MGAISQLIPTAELSAAAGIFLADEDLEINSGTLSPWFPAVSSEDTEVEFWTGTTRTYTEAAPYRAYNVGPKVGTRPGVNKRRVGLPPTSMEYPILELETLQRRAAQGTAVGQIIEEVVYRDVEAGIKAMRNRAQLIMSDWLCYGTTTIDENGVSQTLDSGRIAGREAAAGTAWSTTATADPQGDEDAALLVLRQEEGLGVNDLVVLAGRAAWDEYRNTDQTIAAYQSNRLMDRISDGQAAQVRAEHNYPEVVIIETQITDTSGSTRDLMPADLWVYVPRRAVGEALWSLPAVASSGGITLLENQAPGPVAYVYEEPKPYMLSTVVEGIGIPVFQEPDKTYALTI